MLLLVRMQTLLGWTGLLPNLRLQHDSIPQADTVTKSHRNAAGHEGHAMCLGRQLSALT